MELQYLMLMALVTITFCITTVIVILHLSDVHSRRIQQLTSRHAARNASREAWQAARDLGEVTK